MHNRYDMKPSIRKIQRWSAKKGQRGADCVHWNGNGHHTFPHSSQKSPILKGQSLRFVGKRRDENHPPNFCSIDWRVILTTTTIRSNVSVNVVAVSGKSCLGNGPWPVVFQSFIFVAVERQRWLNARRDHRRLDFARLYIDTSDNDQFGPRTSNDRSTESSG